MGRRKKSSNELDAILEQLKRSYGSEMDSELEDSLLADERSEDDEELSSVLAKIFSDFEQDADKAIADIDADINAQNIVQDTDTVLPAEQAVLTQHSQANTAKDSQNDTPVNSYEHDDPTTQQDTFEAEKEAVDGVLNAMLHIEAAAESDTDDLCVSTGNTQTEEYEEQIDTPLVPEPINISKPISDEELSVDSTPLQDTSDALELSEPYVEENVEDENINILSDTPDSEAEYVQSDIEYASEPESAKPTIVHSHSAGYNITAYIG